MPTPTSPLASNQVRHLRALAHSLKPVVMLGANGLTDAVLAEIELAIAHHELIKVKLAGEDRDERRAIADAICEQLGAVNVQILGHNLIAFRAKPKDSKIVLPKANKPKLV
ncbi:MAG TPA: ribosome assembly RNA-binding protein YhbY [Permianibacter sp.]|nr:ribosome assembly RNA-binding protein YhbY [Permianibacter sp.]